MSSTSPVTEDGLKDFHLRREKCAHILKSARSATVANILAPLLCIPMFQNEVRPSRFWTWLAYMGVALTVRGVMLQHLPRRIEDITEPDRDLKSVTFMLSMMGLGWGLGWPLMTPDLSMVNRMIYVYMATAAMISSMFAYSVNWPTFYAFTLTIIVPAMVTLLWPANHFPWAFPVALVALCFVFLGIARNFSKVFEESVRLRFRNERLYQELASERDQSVAANIAKSKFIAVASHDLRQPLQATNINLELFNPPALTAKNQALLQKIRNSVTALNTMFDALLNMSKLDAYNTQPKTRNFSLKELLESVLGIVQARAKLKGLHLNVHSKDFTVVCDPLLMQQILVNLVLNAIQYTEEGTVEINCTSESGCLRLQVSDTGVGISAIDQANIFKEFYRADSIRALHEGLGLGLTIVKRLCHLIGATIEVESTLGKGSTFTVITRCPVSTEVHSNLQTLPSKDKSGAITSVHLQGKKIAIIEDDGIILDAYRQLISSHGAEIIALSENDEELQSQLETVDRIDCILCDYRLKKTTGDVMIEKLREMYNLDIPAVIVTADTSPARLHTFAKLNVPILYKPATYQDIVSALAETLNRQPA
jgi:signal transduction histidine kinase/ActR/RegA family two-component response regulator